MDLEIKKQERETNISLVRRFSKRMRESGILLAAKKSIFKTREKSSQLRRRLALRKIEKQKEFDKLQKLGLK